MTIGGTTLTIPNEQVLVARARTDPAAFAAIYDHYYPRIFNYAMVRLGDPDAANDITAAVFEKVLKRLGSYRAERGEFGGWLFSIARNEVNSHVRAANRRRWLRLAWIDDLPGHEPGPEAIHAMQEEHARLLGAVAKLAAHEREILALKYGAALTNREIARLVGRSESNVGVILFRALRALRKLLEGLLDNKEMQE